MSATNDPLAEIDHLDFIGLSESFANFGINCFSRNSGPHASLLKDSLLVNASSTVCNGDLLNRTIPINNEIKAHVLAGAKMKR
jgi:hypothetical protein